MKLAGLVFLPSQYKFITDFCIIVDAKRLIRELGFTFRQTASFAILCGQNIPVEYIIAVYDVRKKRVCWHPDPDSAKEVPTVRVDLAKTTPRIQRTGKHGRLFRRLMFSP